MLEKSPVSRHCVEKKTMSMFCVHPMLPVFADCWPGENSWLFGELLALKWNYQALEEHTACVLDRLSCPLIPVPVSRIVLCPVTNDFFY